MKLISFNVGIKIDNSEKVGEFIESEKPDIVALQEVIRHLDESVEDMYKSKFHIERIIDKRLPYHFFGPLWITNAFRSNGKITRDFKGFIEQGNEILSKFPIVEATNEHYYKKYSLALDWTNFKTEDHARAVQIVELNVKGKRLQIINMHGTYSKDKQDSERTISQCKYVLESAKRKDIPTIKLLDNEFRNLIKEYKIKSTRPDFDDGLDTGNNVVDYIFVDKRIKVNSFEVIDTDISDHLPLILDFEITN